ncbi:RNA polymerase sigma factor [Georgenia faecalis]|uniref:RNA polymerase sigma factor n=1 Tax=Georgenia faecalis TaxID=2483799 RepID=A0ABV9DCS1_9MICO|nr:sigma-70 family RNA polymerase sigma factor [Georgenia faecalis]
MTQQSREGTDDDVERFRTVFEATYTDLVRFAERRVHPAVAEEVVAEVFLVAWRRRDHQPREVRPWLFGIARNVMLNRRREDRRRLALQVRIRDAPRADDPDDLADRVARHLDLARAWKHLDARDQETIALIAWDRLSAAEAALVVGCSRGTFTVRLHRARARLRGHLEAEPTPTGSLDRANRIDHAERTEGAPR